MMNFLTGRNVNNIVICGGGTGGHTSAALAFAELIHEKYSDTNIFYIGSINGIESKMIDSYSYIKYFSISTGKFRRSFDYRNFLDFFRFFNGIKQSIGFFNKNSIDLVLSTGGYVCLPVVIAAFMKKIPVISHEQTSVPGLSNSLVFKMAQKIMLSFPYDKYEEKSILTGNPVRIKNVKSKSSEQVKNINTEDRPVLFVTGGANGSYILNSIVINNIQWIAENFDIVIQYGNNQKNIQLIEENEEIIKKYTKKYNMFFSEDEMREIYSMDPILLARSGAGTIADIINFDLCSVLVPLKNSARGEQFYNAVYLVNKHSALMVEEKEMNEKKIKQALLNCYVTRKKIKKNLESIKTFDPDAFFKVLNTYFTK